KRCNPKALVPKSTPARQRRKICRARVRQLRAPRQARPEANRSRGTRGLVVWIVHARSGRNAPGPSVLFRGTVSSASMADQQILRVKTPARLVILSGSLELSTGTSV